MKSVSVQVPIDRYMLMIMTLIGGKENMAFYRQKVFILLFQDQLQDSPILIVSNTQIASNRIVKVSLNEKYHLTSSKDVV